MKKKLLFLLAPVILFGFSAWNEGIRKPVWAGKFYQESPEALSFQLDSLFDHHEAKKIPSERVLALIVPHAGYIYSGQTAASAYSLIRGQKYKSVIIIGPSHSFGFHGCSILQQEGYETPLGVAKIDTRLASELAKASGFKYIPKAHKTEHSVEVQVPFIQKALPEAKIVPIVMGFPTKKTIESLANALTKVLSDNEVLVIASTDMSHFLSKKTANELDMETISFIQSFKTASLLRKIENRENILCGGGPVLSTLFYAQKKGPAKVDILSYADSSQANGPESRVVGYLAAAIYTESPPPSFGLSEKEKKELLVLARSAIQHCILENEIIDHKTQNPAFQAEKGVFVTIKKNGGLRGCIGFIEPALPLDHAVIQAAVFAATRDSRFPPVSRPELKDLEIEISVLSPLKKVLNPQNIEVGKHGLVIAAGSKRGLLLPQVAVENNWSRKTFLEQACLKAGLQKNDWKSDVAVFTFEALVFH
ncbi:AmmeMemoRadiSam system protein B [Acidobacteriota bacterium]